MRRIRALALALVLIAGLPHSAAAEFDWPLTSRLPHHDIAVGLNGGVAFGDSGERFTTGVAGGVDLSYLHGVFGAHLSLTTFVERTGVRLQPLAELSLWYVALVGVGLSVSPFLGDHASDVPETAVTLHMLLGLPIPIWSARPEDGGGSISIMPFARPGFRVQEAGVVKGHHTVGLMVKWSSFGF
ncbi:MAG: hypothetical protein ACPGU1_02250 [Myxococcota bacterium]